MDRHNLSLGIYFSIPLTFSSRALSNPEFLFCSEWILSFSSITFFINENIWVSCISKITWIRESSAYQCWEIIATFRDGRGNAGGPAGINLIWPQSWIVGFCLPSTLLTVGWNNCMQELGLELKIKIKKPQKPKQKNPKPAKQTTKRHWTRMTPGSRKLSSVLKVIGGNSVRAVMSLRKAAKRPENYLPVWEVLLRVADLS